MSYLKIKLNSSFFSAPYAIGSENSVLEPDLAARYRGRGESCPLGLGLASSPRTVLLPPTGPRFEVGERSTGPVMGTAWGGVGIEERVLLQGCRGLLQAGGRLSGCPGPSPVVGWRGSERKGVSVMLGEVAAPCEKGKGKVGKKWG